VPRLTERIEFHYGFRAMLCGLAAASLTLALIGAIWDLAIISGALLGFCVLETINWIRLGRPSVPTDGLTPSERVLKQAHDVKANLLALLVVIGVAAVFWVFDGSFPTWSVVAVATFWIGLLFYVVYRTYRDARGP